MLSRNQSSQLTYLLPKADDDDGDSQTFQSWYEALDFSKLDPSNVLQPGGKDIILCYIVG